MTREESLRELESEIGALIRRLRKIVAERARGVHEDLQGASYLMLAYLSQSGAVRPSVMAENFQIDKGAITRQIQHLEELGLVARTPDPQDGRATLVSLTDDAVRRMADVSAHRRKHLDEQLSDWSSGDLEGFIRSLRRYSAALDKS